MSVTTSNRQPISDLKDLNKLFPDLFTNQDGEGARAVKLILIEGRKRWELQKDIFDLLEAMEKRDEQAELLLNDIRNRLITQDRAISTLMAGMENFNKGMSRLVEHVLLGKAGPEEEEPPARSKIDQSSPLAHYATEQDFIAAMQRLRAAKLALGLQAVSAYEITGFIRRDRNLPEELRLNLKILDKAEMMQATGLKRKSTRDFEIMDNLEPTKEG